MPIFKDTPQAPLQQAPDFNKTVAHDNTLTKHMGAVDAAWNNFGNKTQYIVSFALCITLTLFFLWAAWATVDEVTKGTGQVIPSQRLQVIQHLEGGILEEMLVKEGAHVELNQVLARVNNVSASSSMRETQKRIYSHAAAIARLQAELDGQAKPIFSDVLMKEAPTIVEAEKNAFALRLRQQQEEDNVLNSQIEQRQQEVQENINRKKTFEQALELTRRRVELLAPLVKRKLHSEIDYLNTRQEMVRLQGEVAAITNTLNKIEATLRETEQRKELSTATRHSEMSEMLNAHNVELASLKEVFVAGTDRVMRTELRSPVRGIVNRILINTRGGIVQPGGDIMEIIPIDDSLVVEAKIRPADIAFIHPNQEAIVKVTAYDSAIYGNLKATVEQISADTITNQQEEVYYLVKIRTKEKGIMYKGKELPITPGMIASVDILTGKKTILSYMLKPILRAHDNALKER